MEHFKKNRILALLPSNDLARLTAHMEKVYLPLGRVLYEAGDLQRYVYFPTTAIISLLYVMKNGASAEISVVGRDGMLGISLILGGESTNNRAVVQSAGEAYRLLGGRLKSEFNLHGALMSTLMRYSQALFTQMSQTAVCNRHHTIEQQLCRWLLLSLDRLKGMDLIMTQELIANMLGVRREGVTEAAGKLQRLGAIEYHRGHIHVINRDMLELLSCECYQVVRKEVERLMPLPIVRL